MLQEKICALLKSSCSSSVQGCPQVSVTKINLSSLINQGLNNVSVAVLHSQHQGSATKTVNAVKMVGAEVVEHCMNTFQVAISSSSMQRSPLNDCIMHKWTGTSFQQDDDNILVPCKGYQIKWSPSFLVLEVNLVLVTIEQLIHSFRVAMVSS